MNWPLIEPIMPYLLMVIICALILGLLGILMLMYLLITLPSKIDGKTKEEDK